MVDTYLKDAYFKNESCKLTSQPGGMFFHHRLTSNGSKGFVHPIQVKTSFLCCCSLAQLHPAVCDLMGCRTPGFPVPHSRSEFAQIHVH